jgi:hypothetical protein
MKLFPVILTCNAYLDKRCISIEKTWLTKFDDWIFLSEFNVENRKVYGWGTPPQYEMVWLKYLNFFLNWDFTQDFYLFTDDDTFVNPYLIKEFIKSYNPDDEVCIGSRCYLDEHSRDWFGNYTGFSLHSIMGDRTELPLMYMSGGSGFILSRTTCQKIKEYLKGNNNPPMSNASDVTIGFWLRNSGSPNMIFNDSFWGNRPSIFGHDEKFLKNQYTYHYINSEEMVDLWKIIN